MNKVIITLILWFAIDFLLNNIVFPQMKGKFIRQKNIGNDKNKNKNANSIN